MIVLSKVFCVWLSRGTIDNGGIRYEVVGHDVTSVYHSVLMGDCGEDETTAYRCIEPVYRYSRSLSSLAGCYAKAKNTNDY